MIVVSPLVFKVKELPQQRIVNTPASFVIDQLLLWWKLFNWYYGTFTAGLEAQRHKMRIYVGFLKVFFNQSKLINISKKYYYQWILTSVPSRKGPWGVQEPL